MHLHCVCVLLFMFKKHLHMCGEKDCMSLFVQHLKFFVCVCAFPGGGRRGQFAAGDQRKKWRKREGNDEGLLSETAKLPLSLYHPVWKPGKTHKHIGCCCWLPYKTQDLRHRMINKEHGEQIELKRTQSERQQEKNTVVPMDNKWERVTKKEGKQEVVNNCFDTCIFYTQKPQQLITSIISPFFYSELILSKSASHFSNSCHLLLQVSSWASRNCRMGGYAHTHTHREKEKNIANFIADHMPRKLFLRIHLGNRRKPVIPHW